jgi:hypothetical protein
MRIPNVERKSILRKYRISQIKPQYKPINRVRKKNASYRNPNTDAAFNSKNGKYIYRAVHAINASVSPKRVFL